MHRSPGDTAAARQLFEEAIRRDPQFALAYDALADLYWFLGFSGLMAPRDAWSKGLLHALRAVEIDGALGETHAMVAQYRLRLEFNWPEVDREMRLALDLNPDSSVVRQRYATSGLMPHGRLDEAVAEVERALELDPLSSWTRTWLATLLWIGRHTERAIEEARNEIELDPTFALAHAQLGLALCQEGRFDEGVAALRETVRLFPAPIAQGWLGFGLAFGGHEAEARQLLGRFHAMAAQAYVPPTNFAWIHLGLGEIDEAFAWIDQAIDARDGMMTPIKSYWFLDPLRDDPRFAPLLRKMNFA
jgi:tetratricopeptide (TPR) repeat protein